MSIIILSLFSSFGRGFRIRAVLLAEILALRHQLLVLQRTNRARRLQLTASDRFLWVWLATVERLAICPCDRQTRNRNCLAPKRISVVLEMEKLPSAGRTSVSKEVIDLIRRMSLANPRWGAPRLHGELLRLGFELSESTVAKYMVRCRIPPSQTWRTFLANHAKDLVSSDFFVVPTAFCQVLFVFVILAHDRRRPVHCAVTEYPTSEWVAHQLLEAFPWGRAPQYLLRDRDGSYGERFHQAADWLGIRELLTEPRSPWQNAYVERLIGSIRQECLDHVIVLNETGLRRVLKS